MRAFMNVTKALADETRVRTLLALRCGELCVCQITELFGLAPSTVSKHLSILHQAGLVQQRKEGRWIYYRLPGPAVPSLVRQALDWVHQSLAGESRVTEDNQRLKQVLKCDPTELCKRQCRSERLCSLAPATPAGARWPKVGRAISRATCSTSSQRASRNTA